MKKRLLSLCLAFVMVLAMLPVTALAAGTALSVDGGTVDIIDKTVGPYTLQKLDVYLQTNYEAVSIVSAEQDGNTIDIVLAESTDPSAALQTGFSGVGQGTLQHSGNKCTLTEGSGTMAYAVAVRMGPQLIGPFTYTINFTTESTGPAVKFTTDLSTAEVTYTTRKDAAALTVEAAHSEGETVSYQWYSYTDSIENAAAISEATDESYTPATEMIGTTYYYVVATAGELTATSKTATITVVEPVVQFISDLNTAEVTYTQGKPASALTVAAEYTGVTDSAVTYQWYSYTESVDNATAIDGETDVSYTPATETVGTTYYYVVASCEGLTATSKTATITVVEPVVQFIDDLSTAEVTYTQGKTASALTVAVEYTGVTDSAVAYQWYSYTDSADNAEIIDGATSASYTPLTQTVGTTYYYVVATCGDLTATSKIAKITVVNPVVRFTKDLNTAEETYTQGKPASALTVAADYTGATDNAVTYQWYKNSSKSTDAATAIEDATAASYIPTTETLGTTYYYVVVSCEGLTATSSIATVTVKEQPTLPVTDNVIDIADLTVYTFSSIGSAKVVNIKISGADVEKATQDNNTSVDIVLSGATAPDAEISVDFGTSLSNRFTMSGHTSIKVKLENGKATQSVTLTGSYNNSSSRKDTKTYTLNFSLGTPPTDPPTRLQETDSASTYAGVAVDFNLKDYFKTAKTYYLVEGEEKTPLDGSTYTFKTFTGGTHTLTFAASNDNGFCSDYVTVTVEVTEIKSGAWLGVETSNGSVNYVLFKDADGNEIEGLTASLEGNAINVRVPRSFETGDTITAKFDLTQTDGLPFVSASTAFNQGKGTTTSYTSTISSASVTKNIYLYNAVPKATANNYTTYTINYAIANEAPVLDKGREAAGTASITADQTYTLDLDGIFTDPDADDTITGWKVSVDGAAVNAIVDENHVYSWQTNDAGEYTLVFYGLDNYNAVSAETYTVTLTVGNAETTYDVTVNVPDGIDPTFYYTEDAQEGTALNASENSDNVYTVKVPINVSVISWRADGVGMSAAVSEVCETLTLIQPVFTVKAGENVDTGATVTVAHASNPVGKDGNYLLLAGGGYTIKATPGEDYIAGWNIVELKNQTISEAAIELELVSRDVVITYPYFAELYVGEAVSLQGVSSTEVLPSKTSAPDYASGTRTASYMLTNNKVYEYRVSVPEDNVNRDQYVTYVGTFVKTDAFSLIITKEMLESGDNGRTTIDRNLASNRGNNVGDLYLNINEKGYKTLALGEEFNLIATRAWWGANADWLNTANSALPSYVNYYVTEPDFHYSVVDLDGQPRTGVIEIDENGNIKAVGAGTAIVLVTYDAMTMNHDPKTYSGAIDGYKTKANEFFGAIWPENTGAFVVSVGADASGITTGMTINQDKATGQKVVGKALDAELDIIYFIGAKGDYTFTPGTEGVTVSVANPTVSETSMSFTGFVEVVSNDDGSFSVPLTEGRNIVKLEKDGKAEYQVITAKSVSVTVNGEPLETAAVAPGQTVKIQFDELYSPVKRIAFYNASSGVVYSKISGWDGKLAGNWRNSMGEYAFASIDAKRTIEHFVNTTTDGSSYGNSQVTTTDALTVPADFEGEYFTLTGGAFNIGGFAKYMLGAHRDRLGKTAEGGYQMSDNLLVYLGQLPDISIPVATPTSIAVTTQPTKTEYKIGDVFDPAGMVVAASYAGTDVTRPVTGYTYDTAAFTEAGEKQITITYGQLTTTVTVTVSDIRLEKIEATTAPTKTLYYIGDRFDPTGMVITATYSDNSTREITDYTYAPEVIVKDTTAITVAYGGKTVDVPVTVSLVERLEITTQPTKKNYTEGERFDPTGMVVKAYYTDGSSFETDKYDWSPAGQLSPSDTTITVTYNGSEGAASLQPITVNITVEALQSGDGDDDSGNTPPSYESITVYMTFVNRGSIVVQDTPVVVYDEDRDGTYRIGDAFRALHRDYYPGGESGYAEISGNGVSGWVSKFWGSGDSTFTYARNHRWASSTNNSIYSGDSIAAINGVDSDFFSDLYTWFDSSYSALTEQNETFTVNGLNLMGSSASYNALHAPAGATVSVYKSGSEISGMRTTVGADGSFTLYFTEAGTYTLKISGTAEWGSYTDAPVAPCTCTVYVRKNPTPEEKPEEKPNETPADTVTPEIEADANGEAKVEIGTDAVTDALKQAADENKQSVVVAPVVKGESNTVTVELPKDAVDQIAKESDLPLTVETPAASVTIPSAALNELAAQSGSTVAVSAETVKDESGQATGEVKINITVDSEELENVGGIAVNIPAEEASAGSVLVVVHSDGTETVVKKSTAGENGVAALLDGSATVKIVNNSKEFVDVEPGRWYSDGVDFVSSRELYKGVGNDQFDPAGDMTRGMLVTVLHRLEDEMEHNYEGTFHDVEEDNWYTDAIHWAADHGLVNGYGNGYFGTNDEMTREQMITMTFRYLKWLGVDTSARGDLNTFTDSKEISDWAKEAMEWGVGAGIIEGTGNSLVDPEGNATRAQVAVFMQRVIGLMVK